MEIEKLQTTQNSIRLKYIAVLFLVVSLSLGTFYAVYLLRSRSALLGILTLVGSVAIGVLTWVLINILSDTLVSVSTVLDNTTQIRELLMDIRDGTKNFYKEKRKTRRLSHAITVNYFIGGSQKAILTKTKNIGEFGCFIRTQEPIPHGEILHLEIFLPTFPKPIQICAKVVFVAEQKFHPSLYPGVGLQYTDIKKEDQLKIREFIYTQLSRK